MLVKVQVAANRPKTTPFSPMGPIFFDCRAPQSDTPTIDFLDFFMARSVPWRNRCPVEVAQRIPLALNSGLLVVQQPGPMSFVLKCSTTQRKFKVRVGDPHSCNCKDQNGELLCVHILFVLLKVFRLPQDNSLVWQHAFLEAEVDQLLRGHFSTQRKTTRVEGADGKTVVPRREVGPDDECPICCDAITDERPLVFCRFGCGNNIHASCFKQYATHNSTNPSPLLCPLCREQWGPLDSGVSHGVLCSECHGPVNGERYKCAFCRSYELPFSSRPASLQCNDGTRPCIPPR